MSTDEFLVTILLVSVVSHVSLTGITVFPSSRWWVEIHKCNSAASVQSLIAFLHLPVKVRLNKDAKLCTGDAEVLSYVVLCYFCNRASII